MTRDTKYIMRTLIVLLLFQFISPSLFSVVTLGSVSDEKETTLSSAHSSVVIPIFLMEQEEREHEEIFVKSSELIPSIDFSNHSLTHTASQSLLYKGYYNHYRLGYEPPLFKLNCIFLI